MASRMMCSKMTQDGKGSYYCPVSKKVAKAVVKAIYQVMGMTIASIDLKTIEANKYVEKVTLIAMCRSAVAMATIEKRAAIVAIAAELKK